MKKTYFAHFLLWISIAVSTLSVGYFVYRFPNNDFRDAAMGNLLATIIGVGLGIPVALFIDRKLKESQTEKQQLQISGILERIFVQVANAEQQILFLQQIQSDKEKVSYHQLSQVDIISSLHGVLTNLEANAEMLLALDIVIADLYSINAFLSTLPFLSSDTDSELWSRISFAQESIKTFRETTRIKYPVFWEKILESK